MIGASVDFNKFSGVIPPLGWGGEQRTGNGNGFQQPGEWAPLVGLALFGRSHSRCNWIKAPGVCDGILRCCWLSTVSVMWWSAGDTSGAGSGHVALNDRYQTGVCLPPLQSLPRGLNELSSDVFRQQRTNKSLRLFTSNSRWNQRRDLRIIKTE